MNDDQSPPTPDDTAAGTNLPPEAPRQVPPTVPFKENWLARGKAFGAALLGYTLLAAVLGLLIDGAVEGLLAKQQLRFAALTAALAALLVSGVLMYRRYSPWKIWPWPYLFFLGLLTYAAMFTSTADVDALSFCSQPFALILNILAIVTIAGLLGWTWLSFKAPRMFKAALSLMLLYCASAFIYGVLYPTGIGDLVLGTGLLPALPFYVQPAYLSVQLLFPLATVLFTILAVRRRASPLFLPRVLLALSSLVLLVGGAAALHHQRVPHILSAWLKPPLGIGRASVSFTAPTGERTLVALETVDYAGNSSSENGLFYNMALGYLGRDNGKDTFSLSVKDPAGRDVLFLSRDDFTLLSNNVKQPDYELDFSYSAGRKAQNFILVLDHSNSMEPVIDKLKLAAKAFIDLKKSRDKVMLIPFAGSVKVIPATDSTAQLKESIDRISVQPSTALYEVMTTAIKEAAKLEGLTTIVAMTDGEPTDKYGDAETKLKGALAGNKARIFAVGLGQASHLDEKFLNMLADGSQGKYLRVADAGQLKEVYSNIGAELQAAYTLTYIRKVEEPQVSIKTPSDDQSIAGSFLFSAEVSNAAAAELESVDFLVDGKPLTTFRYESQSAFSLPAQSSDYSDGTHQFQVVARSKSGKSSSAQSQFKIVPEVEFALVSPNDGDYVSETVRIAARLTLHSDKKLDSVDFIANGVVLCSLRREPFECQWNTKTSNPGEVQLEAKATFIDGASYSDSRRVIVASDMSVHFVQPGELDELSLVSRLEVEVQNESSKDPLKRIVFHCDGRQVGETNGSGRGVNFDTSDLAAGEHLVTAAAYTESGKQYSASLRAKVSLGTLVVDRGDNHQRSERGEAKFLFPPDNILLVLDASNSMWGQLAEGSKIEIAKQVLFRVIEMLPETAQVGLRVYGNRSAVEAKNCRDSELLLPFGALDRSALKLKISDIRPKGKTPIEYSLRQAHNDLAGTKGASVVLLITDGLESCNGDPASAAKELKTYGMQTKVHVIGYDVSGSAEVAELVKIADAGGGRYFAAKGLDQLASAVVEAATIDFNVMDSAGHQVLKSKVGSAAHQLRAGPYSITVNLAPPLQAQNVLIRPDDETRLEIQGAAGQYSLAAK